MMFAARANCVSPFFGVMYSTLRASSQRAGGSRRRRRMKVPGSAGLLFALRIFIGFSVLVAIFLTLPSAGSWSAASFDEEATTFLLASFSLLLLPLGSSGCCRAKVTNSGSQSMVYKSGSLTSQELHHDCSKGAPALMLVGVCNPKVMSPTWQRLC